MCGAATHDTVHDAVLGTPSLEYRYPTLRNGGFIAEEYSGYSGIQDDRGTCTGVTGKPPVPTLNPWKTVKYHIRVFKDF